MSESAFLAEWRAQIAAGKTGVKLVGLAHPLDVFVGLNDLGSPKLTIQSKAKPKEPSLSGIVLVDRREGSQGFWHLSLTLQDAKFTEVFLRLVDDVYARSASATSEDQALNVVNGVFDEWRRLLKPRPLGVLSKEELRGLVGELWLVLNRFATNRPIDEAILGWLGPLNAHQDFWYQGSGLHEAKSIGPTMAAVKISSEFQLDPAGEPLELVVLSVADVPETTAGSVSLYGLVADTRAALQQLAASDDDLEARLAHMGVDLGNQYYQDNWFLITSVSNYMVDANFPAIRASDLPPGVERVAYRVQLGSIEPFKTSFQTVG